MRRSLLPVLATLALIPAGCGGDDSSDSSTPAPGPGAEGGNAVAMKDIKFVPADITVKAGDTITWTNEDSVPHDVVNAKDGEEPKSELFGEGKTYEFTPEAAGTIKYVCTVHPGMDGTITVE